MRPNMLLSNMNIWYYIMYYRYIRYRFLSGMIYCMYMLYHRYIWYMFLSNMNIFSTRRKVSFEGGGYMPGEDCYRLAFSIIFLFLSHILHISHWIYSTPRLFTYYLLLILLLYFLFIFYIPRYPSYFLLTLLLCFLFFLYFSRWGNLPDFPSVSSLASF